jgi:hypothetical protein
VVAGVVRILDLMDVASGRLTAASAGLPASEVEQRPLVGR